MVTYKLEKNTQLSEREKKVISAAQKKPVIYDDDSPEMTPEMERAFIAARKKKPLNKEPLTLYVSTATMDKARSFGGDYIAVLSRLLDQAVMEYKVM